MLFERLKNLAAPLPPSYLRRQGSFHLSGLAGKHPLEMTLSHGVLAVLVWPDEFFNKLIRLLSVDCKPDWEYYCTHTRNSCCTVTNILLCLHANIRCSTVYRWSVATEMASHAEINDHLTFFLEVPCCSLQLKGILLLVSKTSSFHLSTCNSTAQKFTARLVERYSWQPQSIPFSPELYQGC